MEKSHRNLLVYLASPSVGNDVNGLIRKLAALDGVRRVAPMAKFSRVLQVVYDPSVIAVRALLERVQRGWSVARFVAV